MLDGRWVNRDPIGEDGGFSIYSFADNRVVYRFDHLGLWSNLRREKNMRYWLVRADADGESIESLLDLLKGTKLHLDGTRAFGDDGWLRKKNENGYASNISGLADIKKGCVYVGPNTAYLTYGDRFPGSYARFSLMPWTKIAAGQIADELEKNKFFVADRAISLDTNTPEFGMDLASINSLLMNNDVAAWAHVGHGKDLSGELLLFDKGAKTSIGHGPNEFTPKWKLSYVILWSCFAGRLDWTPLVAPKGGKVFASKDLLFNGVDMPFRMNMNLNGGTRIQWNPI